MHALELTLVLLAASIAMVALLRRFGMPALVYDKQSRGAIAYLALAGELVRRQRAAAKTATA